MRKIILLFAILLTVGMVQIFAQPVLYGLTANGGYNIGTVSKFESISNNLTAVYKFLPGSRYPYRNELTQAANGNFYGMTNQGGSSNLGTIFSFDPVTNTQTKLHDFNNTNGRYPQGSLVQASDGKLYGMTGQGGSNNYGTIFSFDPVTNTQTKLHDFNYTNGSYPYGSLAQASDGKLYGMTYNGGSSNYGTIFSFDPATNTQTKLYDFNGTNGSYPYGSLAQASDGKLYGMTYNGGSSNYGTIFSFDPVTNTQTKLHDFNSTNGSSPFGSLVQAIDGKLYGMTSQGGSSNYGTIFSYDPGTSTHSLLHDFNSTNGRSPYGSLVQASGKLYGMTSQGGSSGVGTIFFFDPVTNTQTKLHDFNNTNGGYPYGSLVQASNGKLYGMTQTGAVSYLGTIFSFDPMTNIQTKLHDFKDINGSYPYGSLVQATNSKLYGMTSRGGASESGTIFSFDPMTNSQTKLHDFNNTNGRYPYGSLAKASDGKLYGMTYLGGTSGAGIIFSFDPTTNTQTKLHDFNYSNGGYPYGSLAQASDGKLYGMTSQGGSSNYGTIFSFDPMTNTQTKLHDFNNTNGGYPYGSLAQASDGKLYGMTYQGGSSNYGTIFSFDPVTNTQTKLHDFNYTNGGYSYGSLVLVSDGKLYGMTQAGGTSGAGIIFSFDPGSNTQTKLQDFNNTNGGYPLFGNALIEINACSTPTPQISSNSPICNNSNLLLSASGGISYSWSGPDGFTSTDQNPLISNAGTTKAGIYTVIVSNGPTCTATASTNVVIASPLIASSIVTPNASGAVSSTTLTSPADYTFAAGGSNPGNAGGRTWMFSNFNDAAYEGLWWTFNPLANPRHSTQSATGNMMFSSYDVNTGIATFTSSANMVWNANSGTENIATRLRIQFQPFTGTHNGPLNSGWITPVTAGGINLASLPANYPLIDVKSLAGTDNYQVWFALEEASTGLPLNVYYATYPHTSTVGGSIITSIGGNYFSSAPSTCNGGPSTVTVSATGGTAPFTGTGIFQVSNGNYSYTVTDALGCTSITTGTVTPPVPLIVGSVVTPNASGPVSSTTLASPADYTFASGGSNPGNAGGRTWMFSNFNDAAYEGLWWTFNPLANPRHSTQSATGNMMFSSYDVNTGIATFTSSANMVWNANSGTENITTRLRMQFQPYTGGHSGPINSGWITPVTAGGISLASLPANYPLIDVKALAGTDNYQVWFALEEASTGLPLNIYYATYPHTSTVGGSIITSIGGNYFSSAPVGCGGGGSTINITASGGTAPYSGTGSFSVVPGTYSYTVTDALGCTGTTQVTVEPQVDLIAPQITCQANISVNAPANTCLASVNFTSSATDDCSAILKYYLYYGTPEEIEIQSPYNFTVGTHTVTSVASDPTNNKSICNFTVEVKDITAPAITCNSNIISNTDAGTCGAVIIFTPPVGTDNCSGVVTQQISGLASGSVFPIGLTINKYSVTDASGNTAECTFTITVEDKEKPVVLSQSITIQLNSTGAASITVSQINNGSTDNCTAVGDLQLVLDKTTFDCSNVGSNTVTLTVTDGNGNAQTETAIVMVEDKVKPTITTPAPINVNNDPGQCYATVNLGNPVTSDNCGVQGVSNDAPVNFPVGTTTVTWTVTDNSGNTETATQIVTVTDNQKPTITAPANINTNNDAGNCSAVVDLGTPVTGDNCGVQSVTNDHPSATFLVGITKVTWTITDVHGNTETAEQTVTVTDTEKPTINSPAAVNVNNDAGNCSATVNLTAPANSDNCAVLSVTNDHPSNIYLVGSTTVTWTVTDIHGNTETATQMVTVTDNQKPTITAPAAISVNNDAGLCTAVVSLGNTVRGDNCGVQSVTNDHPSNVYPVGTTTVTWTVTDIHGNTQTAIQTVTVTDNENPLVVTKNISVQLNSSGTASITAASVNNGSTDNCGIQTMSVSPSSFNCTNIGNNTVTLTETDIHGNVQTNTAVVNITAMSTSSSVTVTPSTRQYSDKVTITAELTPGTASGGCQAATHVTFTVGTKVVGTVPLVLQGNTLVGTLEVALFETIGTSHFSPGIKTVTASFTGVNQAFAVNSATTNLTITKEDARVNYTGALFAGTACTTCSNATVTLSVTVQDITATPDAAGDADNGDIRLAKVRFINRDNNTPISGWLTVGLVNGSDIKTGAVTFNWSVNIGTADADNFTVGIEVDNGYYYRNNSDDNVVVTVSKPLNDFATGGGFIIPTNSNGQYASDPGTKNNFGFNVKYNKTGKSLQGKLNFIIRRTESDGKLHIYQIKGTSMSSLSVNSQNPAAVKAIFNGKANLQDITNPLIPVSLSGNLTLQVEMTDKGEPGNTDSYALTVWNSAGGIIYSSNWVTNRTTEMTLSRGNIQVRGTALTKTAVTVSSTITSSGNNTNLSVTEGSLNLQVKVLPNPSQHQFQLKITSNGKGTIHLRVTDIQGRIVEERRTDGSNQQITLGENWYNGTYILELSQGGERKTLQLVKLK